MKFSYTWLREMVEGLDESPKDLMRLITLKTAECEGVEEVGALLANASEARIVTVEPIYDDAEKELKGYLAFPQQ